MSRTGKQSHHVGGHSKIQRQKTNTTHKFRAKMDLTPPITIFSLSVGSVRFSCKMLSESVQLHPPSSDPSGRWLHKISHRLSTPRKRADMPPIKVLGGQMRVKGRLKGVILWVHVPNWKTKSSCGRTQRNSKTEDKHHAQVPGKDGLDSTNHHLLP